MATPKGTFRKAHEARGIVGANPRFGYLVSNFQHDARIEGGASTSLVLEHEIELMEDSTPTGTVSLDQEPCCGLQAVVKKPFDTV
jgi:hypothetical protein